MRVLMSAFGFSPYHGSECAVGWNIAKGLAGVHDVTVLTGDVSAKENFYARYEKENGGVPRLTVVYVRPGVVIRFFEKLHKLPCLWPMYYVAYNLWQRKAYRIAKQMHEERPFDVVHQLNMIGYREPGYLWKLDAPFVWGPVGGGPNEPFSFLGIFSWSGRVHVFVRMVANELQKRINFRARKAAHVAKKIWTVTDADYRMIYGLWGVKCEKMVETGTVLRSEGHVRCWDCKDALRVVWSGIHTARKALPILILALEKVMARRDGTKIVVDVLGEGEETQRWKRLAETLGVAGHFAWHGKLPHDKALEVMNSGHVLAFSSLKEGTPHVVLEALSLGVPVICHDACGMGTVVTEGCGMKVPLKNPGTSVDGFANAILAVMSNPDLVRRLSLGALARSSELTWDAKTKEISKGYEVAVGIRNGVVA